MALSNLLINGFSPSWGEFNLQIAAQEIQVLSLNFSESIEEAIGYGKGNVPARRSRGRYDPGDCSFAVYVEDAPLMEAHLLALPGVVANAAAGGAPRLSDAIFAITGQFARTAGAPTIVMSFENCRILQRGTEISDSPDLTTASYNFKPYRIKVNGAYL